jgi:hypothetical protein
MPEMKSGEKRLIQQVTGRAFLGLVSYQVVPLLS